METISYAYEGALYVNLTNRCDCACVFCLRHNGHKGSIYADDLWLDHEPTREEALMKMKWALAEFIVEGVDTNIDFQLNLMKDADVEAGRYDIGFLTRRKDLFPKE